MGEMLKEKKKIYLLKRLVARKGFSPSTLATIVTIHTTKQRWERRFDAAVAKLLWSLATS